MNEISNIVGFLFNSIHNHQSGILKNLLGEAKWTMNQKMEAGKKEANGQSEGSKNMK